LKEYGEPKHLLQCPRVKFVTLANPHHKPGKIREFFDLTGRGLTEDKAIEALEEESAEEKQAHKEKVESLLASVKDFSIKKSTISGKVSHEGSAKARASTWDEAWEEAGQLDAQAKADDIAETEAAMVADLIKMPINESAVCGIDDDDLDRKPPTKASDSSKPSKKGADGKCKDNATHWLMTTTQRRLLMIFGSL
jgi:hypothetical protein